MTLRSFCTICNKEIGDVPAEKLKSLTGKEICSLCGAHLKDMRAGMEEAKEEFLAAIDKSKKETAQRHGDMIKFLDDQRSRCQNLYQTRQAEIDAKLKDIIS